MSDDVCDRCGAFGEMDHGWVEGDCVLPHRSHSTHLAEDSHVCTPCLDRHVEWLGEIVDLFATLNEVLEPGSIPDDTADHKRPKKQPSTPSPIRLHAWALMHPEYLNSWITDPDNPSQMIHTGMTGIPDVADLLSNWAQALFDDLGWTNAAPNTVSGAVAVLKANAATMVTLADVDTYDAELRWIRRSLRSAHGLGDPQPVGRCLTTTCGGNVWPMSVGNPTCDRCGRVYGTHDLVRLKLHEKRMAS